MGNLIFFLLIFQNSVGGRILGPMTSPSPVCLWLWWVRWQKRFADVIKDANQVPFSCVWLFATPWTAARQASLSITNSQSLLKLMSVESVMPSNHLILCPPLLLPPSIFPSIRVFSSESVLGIRWSKYCSFSFSISPSNEGGSSRPKNEHS